MKPARYVTHGLLVAAFATIGCSNTPDTSPTASPVMAVAKLASKPSDAISTPPTDLDSAASTATPAPSASFADGEAAYNAKKYEEAMAIFDAYVVRRPHNGWGHYMLALSAWKHGDLEKSEQAFEKALSIDPGHIKSLVNLSRVRSMLNRHDEAIARLVRAAEIDPESLEVQRLLGRTYHAQGKTAEAEEAYRRALALNDRDAWTLNYLGLVLLETARPDEALPLLIQAVELRKDVAEFHNTLGLALEQQGHLDAAATAYVSALRVDSTHDQARQNLARLDPQ
jgi:tetratricopeptide (TPR) repeat protein